MRSRVLLALLATSMSAVVAQDAPRSGGAILRGVTIDSAGAPLAGVEVLVGARGLRAISDDSGRFRFAIPEAGTHMVTARRMGLAPESLSTVLRAGDTSFVRITLRSQAAEIGGVAVEGAAIPARLQGFEHRRARKNGAQFITRQDIDRSMPNSLSDLLRRAPGIKIIDSAGVMLAISSRGPKIVMVANRPIPVQCVVRIGVDGNLKEPYFPMNTIIQEAVYGIEVYPGASTIPLEFGGARKDAECGLIMIWTRTY